MIKRLVAIDLSLGALLLALAVVSTQFAHSDDGGPGFDCGKVRTPIEHVLCSNDEPTLPWLDHTLAVLYRQLRSEPGADVALLTATQRRWLDTRDRCHGDDAALRACLGPLYWRRIEALAARTGPTHVTGLYLNPDIRGTLRAVGLPDGSIAVNAESGSGPPRDASCLVSATLKPVGGRMICKGEDCTGVEGCVITISPMPGRFTISSSQCSGLCGMGTQIDGVYTSR